MVRDVIISGVENMKTIEDYISLPYRMEIMQDPDEGGFVVSYPDLPGCLTSADNLTEAIKNAEDAKKEWLLAALEDGYTIPEPNSLEHYSGQYRLRLPKSLHRLLSEHAKAEGVSLNQYCVYLLARNDALEAQKHIIDRKR